MVAGRRTVVSELWPRFRRPVWSAYELWSLEPLYLMRIFLRSRSCSYCCCHPYRMFTSI